MLQLTARVLVAILSAAAGFGCDLAQLERTLNVYPHAQSLLSFRCYREVPGASAYLAQVLENGQRLRSWPMAVTVLGVIGDQEAYDGLVSFLANQRTRDPEGRMTWLEFSAKVDAITMIDYLRRYTPDLLVQERATALLSTLAEPDGWRRYQWKSPEHDTPGQSNAYLASKTRFALGRKTPDK